MSVTREELHEQVWAEPMTMVAARYEVSSSFLARVCERLGVPRPPRGYWAKFRVGKQTTQRPLPPPQPGDELEWSRGGFARPRSRVLPRPPAAGARRRHRFGPRPARHPLVDGVTELFQATWPVENSGYLRPRKKRLPDIVCSTGGLSRALAIASEFYLTLEDAGHRVKLAPDDQYYRRPDVDHREGAPEKRDYYSRTSWTPARPTVVFIGTVAIGLTVYELSARTEVRYVNGKYVPVAEAIPTKGIRGRDWHDWTTHHDLPTGRLVIRAYSPYTTAEWSEQWPERKVGELDRRLKRIVRALEVAAPVIADLVEEGERRAEIERQRWEVECRERARQEAIRRRAQAEKESRDQLLAIVDRWALARNIESFFEDAARLATRLPDDAGAAILQRLDRARQLLGGIDPLRYFETWQAPEDRLPNATGDDNEDNDL